LVAAGGLILYLQHLNILGLKTALTLLVLILSIQVGAQNSKSYEQAIPGSTVKFKMVAIPAGTFQFGSPTSDKNAEPDERPQKNVQVSAFWMSEKEVTFGEWDTFFKNMEVPQTKAIAVDAISRPTAQYIDLTWGMGRDANQPTNSMSQQAAIMYCKWLYEKTQIFYRLPTEAEWEYACKAGSKDAVPTVQKQVAAVGYSKENSQGKFQKVKSLKPNAWGLYDMLGNLSEWTLDQYDAEAYKKLTDNAKDPVVPSTARYPKVVRGGSYMDDPKELRCTNRIASDAAWNKRDPQIPKSKWWLTDGMFVGFRLVRPAVQPSKEEIEKFFTQYLK
jgi:formylglycine-generating enzyme required for sulfatase activity